MVCIEKRPYTLYGRLATLHFRYLTCLLDRGHIRDHAHPVYFQAIGAPIKSSVLTIVRTVVLFVPLGWVFAHFGLNAFWLTYPLTEIITTITGYVLYRKQLRQMKPAKLG